jgi:chromosomal replication initiator protein
MRITPRPDSTFDRFVATTGSRKALDLARAFAARRTAAPRLLFLYGPPGVGKSHLLHSILHVAASGQPHSVAHTTARELVDDLVATPRSNSASPSGPRVAAFATLAIDDLHFLAGKPATQRESGRLLKEILSSGVRVACAATCEIEDVDALAGMLQELPEARKVALARPTENDLRRIVAALAEQQALRLTAQTIATIAGRSYGDARRAIGALNRQRFEQQV